MRGKTGIFKVPLDQEIALPYVLVRMKLLNIPYERKEFTEEFIKTWDSSFISVIQAPLDLGLTPTYHGIKNVNFPGIQGVPACEKREMCVDQIKTLSKFFKGSLPISSLTRFMGRTKKPGDANIYRACLSIRRRLW